MKSQPPNSLTDVIHKAAKLRGQRGGFHIVIQHDDWCDLLAGKGACNCNPEVGEPSRNPPTQEKP